MFLSQRTNLPIRHCKYDYLRHLKLELVIFDDEDREIDALDYAQVLEVAPFIEKLELHVSLFCWCTIYHYIRKTIDL